MSAIEEFNAANEEHYSEDVELLWTRVKHLGKKEGMSQLKEAIESKHTEHAMHYALGEENGHPELCEAMKSLEERALKDIEVMFDKNQPEIATTLTAEEIENLSKEKYEKGN